MFNIVTNNKNVRFLIKRLLQAIFTNFIISLLSFIVIQAPPGDFATNYVEELFNQGENVGEKDIEIMRKMYGLDQPLLVQYFKWFYNLIQGKMGFSLKWGKPVKELISERLANTIFVSLTGFLIVYIFGIPIGILSATKQYSIFDYFITFFGFIGLAIPTFLLALMVMWLVFAWTGSTVTGLFSVEYEKAPWSFMKLIDLLKHIWLPGLVIGLTQMAGLIRVLRANLLDELEKPYVMVARAKGLSPLAVLFRYPVRIAVNPVISTIGWILPALVNGELMAAMVMGLPTIAPLLLESLRYQDMFVAGGIIFLVSILTVIGTFISDILLMIFDPRINLTGDE